MKKNKIDFTAYIWGRREDLDPAYLKRCRDYLAQLPRPNPFQATSCKQQAASNKLQAASNKLLTKRNKGLYRIYESNRIR
jgi:hypothetical protein